MSEPKPEMTCNENDLQHRCAMTIGHTGNKHQCACGATWELFKLEPLDNASIQIECKQER